MNRPKLGLEIRGQETPSKKERGCTGKAFLVADGSSIDSEGAQWGRREKNECGFE
jgi:hypothetical protein